MIRYSGLRTKDSVLFFLLHPEMQLKRSSFADCAVYFYPSPHGEHLGTNQEQPQAFALDVRMESFVKIEHSILVFRKINTQSVVRHCDHDVVIGTAALHGNNGGHLLV